jgi:hypothetical protein
VLPPLPPLPPIAQVAPAPQVALVAPPVFPEFDLSKSVVSPGLWRPPPSSSKGPSTPARAPARALTLDPDEEEELRMMPAWDLPEPSSMAEPSRRPIAPRANSSRRPPPERAPRSQPSRGHDASREPRSQPSRGQVREPRRAAPNSRRAGDAARPKRKEAPRSLWADLAERASAWLRRSR